MKNAQATRIACVPDIQKAGEELGTGQQKLKDLLFLKDKFSGVTRNSKPLVHFIITVSSTSSSSSSSSLSLSSGPPQPSWMPCDTTVGLIFHACRELRGACGPRGRGTPDFNWRGWSKDFLAFETFDSGIFRVKIWLDLRRIFGVFWTIWRWPR